SYGFRIQGHADAADHRSVLLQQGDIQLVTTAGLTDQHPATAFVAAHGDGPATIALRTDDPESALTAAGAAGAVPLLTPRPLAEAAPPSRVRIAAFGDVAHTFVTKDDLAGRFIGGTRTP